MQRQYTSRMGSFQTFDQTLNMPVCNVNYHDRLKRLKIYSLERRRDRYTILYIYKIIIGTVPNPGLQYTNYERHGIKVTPKFKRNSVVQSIRNASFFVKGTLMYNNLPMYLRLTKWLTEPTAENVIKFKNELDSYFETIPDLPGTLNNSLVPKI